MNRTLDPKLSPLASTGVISTGVLLSGKIPAFFCSVENM